MEWATKPPVFETVRREFAQLQQSLAAADAAKHSEALWQILRSLWEQRK